MARYRVTATFVYDVDLDLDYPDAIKTAEAKLDELLSPQDIIRKQVRLEKLKEKRCSIHLGEFKPEEVLPYISKEEVKKEYQVGDKVYLVRMNSQRYFIFRESLCCAACGIPGSKMILEQNLADKSPHFNLYAEENGRLILMTKDHVQPKAFGGEDRHSNFQTMCSICNNLKGSANLTLEAIRELRTIYNDNRGMPRKKIRELLCEAKTRLSTAHKHPHIGRKRRKRFLAEKKSKQPLYANTDIHVWLLPTGELVGRSVYEHPLREGMPIACIKTSTELEPVDFVGGKVIVKLDTEICMIYQGYLDVKEEYEDDHPIVIDQAVS